MAAEEIATSMEIFLTTHRLDLVSIAKLHVLHYHRETNTVSIR